MTDPGGSLCYISDKHKATGKPEVMSLEPLPAQLGKGRSTMELGSEIPPGKDGSTELLASWAVESGGDRRQRRPGELWMWGGNGDFSPSSVHVWEPRGRGGGREDRNERGDTPAPAPPTAVPKALLPPVGAAAPQAASIAPYITPRPGPNRGVLEQVHQIVN